MTKIKAFFALTALLLVGVGVFAGKSKFFDSYTLYLEYDPGTGVIYEPFTSSIPPSCTIVQNGNATVVTCTSQGGFTVTIWYYDITNPSTVPQKKVYPSK